MKHITTYSKTNPNRLVLYGQAVDFFQSIHHERILGGPYDTGKTWATTYYSHRYALKYPGSTILFLKKTRKDNLQTLCVTFEKVIQYLYGFRPSASTPLVRITGGKNKESYEYDNGSQIINGGLDDVDKYLGMEPDLSNVSQAERLAADEWEAIVARTTGRGASKGFPTVTGDCNPQNKTHWIRSRKTLLYYPTYHRDNPGIYLQPGMAGYDPNRLKFVSSTGKMRMQVLEALTGIRRMRGLEGLWTGVEGVVYENYNPDFHVISRKEFFKRVKSLQECDLFRSIDFGSQNPYACGWFARDKENNIYLYRQWYQTGEYRKNSRAVAKYSYDERYVKSISDHEKSAREFLDEEGIKTIAAMKDVSTGIEALTQRIGNPNVDPLHPDYKKPTFYIVDDDDYEGKIYGLIKTDPILQQKYHPTRAEEEFESYAWMEEMRASNPDKYDEPVKEFDHMMDLIRYLIVFVDRVKRKVSKNIFSITGIKDQKRDVYV